MIIVIGYDYRSQQSLFRPARIFLLDSAVHWPRAAHILFAVTLGIDRKNYARLRRCDLTG